MHRKKAREIPDHEKLRVISRYWGVLHRVSELLFLSEYWLPSCKRKQSVSTSFFTKFWEVLPQSQIFVKYLFVFTYSTFNVSADVSE